MSPPASFQLLSPFSTWLALSDPELAQQQQAQSDFAAQCHLPVSNALIWISRIRALSATN
jgi:hypothetical protein